MLPEDKRLTPEQYWKWRALVQEFEAERAKLQIHELRRIVTAKDGEIKRLQAIGMSTQVSQAKDRKDAAQKEYETFKQSLSEAIGMSLDNCVIGEDLVVKQITP